MGAECPPPQPRDFWPGHFYWPIGKKEAREKGENGEEKKEKGKKEGVKLQMEGGKVTKWEEDFFSFTFQNHKNLFWSTKMEIFYRKKHFMPGKKIWKNDFAPSEKLPVTPLLGTLKYFWYCYLLISVDINHVHHVETITIWFDSFRFNS